MPLNAVSDQGLHCLLLSLKRDARLIWVKVEMSNDKMFVASICEKIDDIFL